MRKYPSKEYIETIILNCLSLKEFCNKSGLSLHHKRDKDIFYQHYGIDIMEILQNNINIFNLIKKMEFENLILICDNCGNEYRNGDRLKENKSGRHFCSDECSKKFSASCGNTEEKKIEKSIKMKKLFQCGKIKIPNQKTFEEYEKERKEYELNPKKCPICGVNISYKRKRLKTCCNEHGRILNGMNNHKTQQQRHSSGGKRYGSGRGKKGWYKGYYCDSSWELAWVIYNLEHNIKFERNNNIFFEYTFDETKHRYYPDFIQNGEFVEIKGYNSKQWETKLKCIPIGINLKTLYRKDIKPYIDYVVGKYGKDYVRLYEKRV